MKKIPVNDPAPVRCQVCGWTPENPHPDGAYFVAPDLCSRCAEGHPELYPFPIPNRDRVKELFEAALGALNAKLEAAPDHTYEYMEMVMAGHNLLRIIVEDIEKRAFPDDPNACRMLRQIVVNTLGASLLRKH